MNTEQARRELGTQADNLRGMLRTVKDAEKTVRKAQTALPRFAKDLEAQRTRLGRVVMAFDRELASTINVRGRGRPAKENTTRPLTGEEKRVVADVLSTLNEMDSTLQNYEGALNSVSRTLRVHVDVAGKAKEAVLTYGKGTGFQTTPNDSDFRDTVKHMASQLGPVMATVSQAESVLSTIDQAQADIRNLRSELAKIAKVAGGAGDPRGIVETMALLTLAGAALTAGATALAGPVAGGVFAVPTLVGFALTQILRMVKHLRG